jgi:hypothetical protein
MDKPSFVPANAEEALAPLRSGMRVFVVPVTSKVHTRALSQALVMMEPPI